MLRQALQSLLVHVRRTFWGKTTLLGKRRNFSSFLEFEQTVFRILTKIFRQGGHNRILRAQMKFFWRREVKENFFFENFALLSLSDFERKRSLILLQASLRQACQISLYMFRRRFLQKIFLEGLLIFPPFQKSCKIFSEFWRENFGSVVTTSLYMYIGTFLGKLFSFRKVQCFFRGFRNLSCQSVVCKRKLFATVVKIAYSVAKESFLMKTNSDQKKVTAFFWTMGNFFAFLATTLQQSCQNFFVHVQTKILRENRFFGKFILFSIISGVRAKSFQSFDEKFLAGFSQLHSTCTLEHLEDIYYPFAKFPIFLVVFGIWAANLWILREKIC